MEKKREKEGKEKRKRKKIKEKEKKRKEKKKEKRKEKKRKKEKRKRRKREKKDYASKGLFLTLGAKTPATMTPLPVGTAHKRINMAAVPIAPTTI